MAQRFRDPIKAAQYLSQGIQHDFPEGRLRVFRLQKRKPRQKSIATSDMERVLVDLCRDMGEVGVDYHPGNAYGFVAEVESVSNGSDAAPVTVYVLVTQVKGRPLAVGSRIGSRTGLDLEDE